MDIIYAMINKLNNNNIINLIYSYLDEHPIVKNTDITDSIYNWNFTDDMENEYTFSFYYFNTYMFENYIDPSDDYEYYLTRFKEFG